MSNVDSEAIYDPITDKSIPSNSGFPDSFWSHSINAARNTSEESLQQDVNVDVVIIGGGYSGLSCAYHLQQYNRYAQKNGKSGVTFTLIEANQPGYGCSGRNGGFVLPGSGRLGLYDLSKRFGETKAVEIFSQYIKSTKLLEGLIESGIECDKTQGGYLKLATTDAALAKMQREAELQQKHFGNSFHLVPAARVKEEFIQSMPISAGLFAPDVFAINPLKLAQGLAQKIDHSSASAMNRIYGNTPMLGAIKRNGCWHITTPQAAITANHVVNTTNAYMPTHRQFEALKNRTFPVLSSVLVTKPLSDIQLSEIGMRNGLMAMDTRSMKYYYRLLPDNRLLFGGRGAISGKRANAEKYKQGLLQGLLSTFPRLQQVDIDYFWSGWVSVSFDDFPRVFHDTAYNFSYASGYCGSGLAFSLLSGKQLAHQITGEDSVLSTAFSDTPLPKIPFSSFKRTGLNLYYQWQAFMDYWQK